MGKFNQAVRKGKSVDERLKNLVELKGAQMIGCEFCVDLGSQICRNSGLSDEELLALPRYRQSDLFTDREKLALDYTVAVMRTPVEVTDELFAQHEGALQRRAARRDHRTADARQHRPVQRRLRDRLGRVQRGNGLRAAGPPRRQPRAGEDRVKTVSRHAWAPARSTHTGLEKATGKPRAHRSLICSESRALSSPLAGLALQSPPARWVEFSHLLREVAERDVAVLVDECRDLGLGSQRHVFLARVRGGVMVSLAFATADEEAFLAQPRHYRHVGRVRAGVGGGLVQALHHGPNGAFAGLPDFLHDLGLELVQWGRRRLAARFGALSEWHLRRIIAIPSALAAPPARRVRAGADRRSCARSRISYYAE